jgi:UDP-N-acetylglucosamine--N-acetylmuramyl-(pentapeptide) pyrophosphoryl-undecaprenol N-acetylglucosamine transferase
MPDKIIKIVLAGGGTAGHINPLISVGAELRSVATAFGKKVDLFYVGSGKSNTERLRANDIPARRVAASRLSRYFDLRNIYQMPLFLWSIFQSLWYLFWIMPDVVFSKGGPGSLAVILAARFYRIPVAIHESDAIPSLTTRVASHFAYRVFLSFEDAIQYFPQNIVPKCETVGNPLRSPLFVDIPSPETAKKNLGFDLDRPLVLVMGGSQGSERINNLIVSSIPYLIEGKVQILHQTGGANFESVRSVLGNYWPDYNSMVAAGYRPIDFFKDELKDALSAADLVVSRSGSSIFEFAAFGKPSILIPLPESASAHQLKNAEACARAGMSIVMEEKDISIEKFVAQVVSLAWDNVRLSSMSESANKFTKLDAAKNIAIELLSSFR